MESPTKIKTSNPTTPASAKPNPGNLDSPRSPVKALVNECVKASVELGGTPEEVTERAVACSLVKIAAAAFSQDPPEAAPANPGPQNPGGPGTK